MARPRDESMVDRDPPGVRVMRPSRFGVVSLVVLLALGCGLNLYIAHQAITWGPKPDWTVYMYPQRPDPGLWPVIPAELKREGTIPTEWQLMDWLLLRRFAIYIEDPRVRQGLPYRADENGDPYSPEDRDPVEQTCILFESRFGAPFVARSTTHAVVEEFNQKPTQVWPTANTETSPRVTYHPLGLILNPIIYALPIWVLVMSARWTFIARRSHKRKHLGLCVSCAYELDGLSVCPECGRERSAV